jgi:hypothetical protein
MISLLKSLLKRCDYYLFVLIAIAVLTHLPWFDLSTTLFSWDWKLWPDNVIKLLKYGGQGTYLNWFNFGESNIQIYFNFLFILWGVIGTYTLASKLTVMIPIAILSVVSPYLLIKNILNDKQAAFLGALVFGFSTTLLYKELSHLFLALSFSLIPLVLHTFLIYLDRKNLTSLIQFLLIFNITALIEVRMAYVSTIILVIAFLIVEGGEFSLLKKKFSHLCIALICTCLIHIFWILPTLQSGTEHISEIASRGLFGDNFANLIYAFTNSYYSWTGSYPTSFILQPVKVHAWFISIFSICSIFLINKITTPSERKKYIFVIVIFLVGLLLTKQSSQPFPNLYLWLYENFPGFSLFRESSKFFILNTLGMSILFAFTYKYAVLKSKLPNFFKKLVFLSLFLITLINTKPLITQEIGHLFSPQNEPVEYSILNSKLLLDNEMFRTMWIPRDSRWALFSLEHPKVLTSVITDEIKPFKQIANTSSSTQVKLLSILSSPISHDILSTASVRYVLVPLEDNVHETDLFYYYGGRENPDIREWYINQLDFLPYLEKIDIDTKELVVYENKEYLPYIRPITELIGYESFTNLEKKYEFAHYTLNLPIDFLVTSRDRSVTLPYTYITNLYEDTKTDDFKGSNIIGLASSSIQNSNNLYANSSERVLEYVWNNENIDISTSYLPSLNSLGEKIDTLNATTTFIKKIVASSSEYIIVNSGQILPLIKSNVPERLPTIQTKFIYQVGKQNSLLNGNFDTELWQETVGDCHDYDNNSILGMQQSNVASDGEGSLELSATRHIACTKNRNISLEPGQEYLFSFDYQGIDAREAGYNLSFGGSASTILSERVPIKIKSREWQTYQRLISAPVNSTDATLFLYAYETDKVTNNIVRYDNVRLSPVTLVETIEPDTTPKFEAIPLPPQESYEFTFSDPAFTLENIILNPSFESGLWSETVGDCHDYDSNPSLGMQQGNIASDGQKSLELSATRHIACTNPGRMPVNGGSRYLFSFDYMGDSAEQAGYNIGFNDSKKSAVSERLPIDRDAQGTWQTFTKQIEVPNDATSLSLHVYAYQSNGKRENLVRYDNFSLIELPPIHNRYYLVSDPQTNFVEPSKVEFTLVNPTKKLVHIKGATTPFYLAMSESFHPQAGAV